MRKNLFLAMVSVTLLDGCGLLNRGLIDNHRFDEKIRIIVQNDNFSEVKLYILTPGTISPDCFRYLAAPYTQQRGTRIMNVGISRTEEKQIPINLFSLASNTIISIVPYDPNNIACDIEIPSIERDKLLVIVVANYLPNSYYYFLNPRIDK